MAKQKTETKKKEYVPKETTKVGDIVGKAYDINDSPIGEITKSSKTKYKYTDTKSKKSVKCDNLRKLVEKDYLTATGGKKYVYIRWKRTKNFNISDFVKPWVDKRPHCCSESIQNP